MIITNHTSAHKTAALIVAAGRGRRMGEPVPKQYLQLGGRAVLHHTVQAFLASDRVGHVAVVLHPDDHDLYQRSIAGIEDTRLGPPVNGGETRAQSVQLGLDHLVAEAPSRVLIHDAARPFVSGDVIGRVIDALDTHDGAFAAIPVVDALWRANAGQAVEAVPRDGLWRAQTPQGFRFDKIRAAHSACRFDATDDVAVARAAGLEVAIVTGSDTTFKLTTPEDMARAELLLAKIR